jgi:hypothetical protein
MGRIRGSEDGRHMQHNVLFGVLQNWVKSGSCLKFPKIRDKEGFFGTLAFDVELKRVPKLPITPIQY